MRTLARFSLPLCAAALLAGHATAQYRLVWQDEFSGTDVDPSKWDAQIGTGCPSLCGWGNNELQYYREENATVDDGMLTITARDQNFGGAGYTSARLRTRGLGDWTYGRFEMRAKLPTGQGIWPAFWMLPTDSAYGVWAASGEIDIMEIIGSIPDRVHGTIHHGGTFPANTFTGSSYTLPQGDFIDDFHIFAVEWDETEMRWFMDDQLYFTNSSWFSTGGAYPAPFDQRFHLLLNVAVGGNWPGNPNGSTSFPQEMIVDYVRVYQREGDDCLRLFDDMEHGAPAANGWEITGGGNLGILFGDTPPVGGGFTALKPSWGASGIPGPVGRVTRTAPIDVSQATHVEFWVRPDAGQQYQLEVRLLDDDNGDNIIPSAPDGGDDEFVASLTVAPGSGGDLVAGGGWQLVSIPLSDFVDDGSFHFGGNGVFDPLPIHDGGNGQLIEMALSVSSLDGGPVSFSTDIWRFVQGDGEISGRVWDDIGADGIDFLEPGLAGVVVELADAQSGNLLTSVVTDSEGYYVLPAVSSGQLAVRIDTSTLPAGAQPTFDPDGIGTPHITLAELACGEQLTFMDFGYAAGDLQNYCTGAPNSAGPGSSITATGSLSISAGEFTLAQSGGVANQFGIFYFGPDAIDVSFGEGRRCVGGSVYRFMPAQQAASDGSASHLVNFGQLPGSVIAPGSSWNFQYWYRDPSGGPSGFNLSDALTVTFWP